MRHFYTKTKPEFSKIDRKMNVTNVKAMERHTALCPMANNPAPLSVFLRFRKQAMMGMPRSF